MAWNQVFFRAPIPPHVFLRHRTLIPTAFSAKRKVSLDSWRKASFLPTNQEEEIPDPSQHIGKVCAEMVEKAPERPLHPHMLLYLRGVNCRA